MEAKCKKDSSISEAVEKALALRMEDVQSKLEKCVEEKSTVADVSSPPLKRNRTHISCFSKCRFLGMIADDPFLSSDKSRSYEETRNLAERG